MTFARQELPIRLARFHEKTRCLCAACAHLCAMLNVCAVLEQQTHDLCAPLKACERERRVSIRLNLRVYVGATFEKQRCGFSVAVH